MVKLTDKIYENVVKKNPGENEFHQAVKKVLDSLDPVLKKHSEYVKEKIVNRLVEPERQIMFRVTWTDDNDNTHVNRGFRIGVNSAIGPYKGGLRFHPSVNLGIIKFLSFEQIFKNALTGLPLGGAKGGSDFDPKGKSNDEVMRFCYCFMSELYRHIGPNTDVPAGGIGVGAREIGYLYGMYKKITNTFTGVLTGKGLEYGGSLVKSEATGYGVAYFTEEMLKAKGKTFKGKSVAISGSGNIAQYTTQKIIQLGGKVVTLSDSDGTIYDPEGICRGKCDFVSELKNRKRGRIKEFAEEYGVEYYANKKPWSLKADMDVALPCATQNELDINDARTLLDNGVMAVAEGGNMPTTTEAINLFIENGVSFGPGKAANAGGVVISGLEMSQNSLRTAWTFEEVDQILKNIMVNIHTRSTETAKKYGYEGNLVVGANIAGFLKVANAMLAQNIVS